jgi:hypothetical protein
MKIQPVLLQPGRSPKGPDQPQPGGPDLFVGGSGALLGGALGGLAGSLLGREYGTRLVQNALPQAWTLVQQGWISPQTALRAYQSLMHPATQVQLGALGVGSVGAALGLVVALSLYEASAQ